MITTPQPRRCALQLEALPNRIGQVRRIVSAYLRYWNLSPVLDPALLGVTELLANVHRHAEPDKHCTVELSFDEGLLTVSVTDHDPRPPRTGPPADPLGTSGRGLTLLEALTDAWGSRPDEHGSGKIVWFALGAPALATAPVAPAAPVVVAVPAAAAATPGGPQPVAAALA